MKSFTDLQIVEAFRAGGTIRERAWEFAYKDWRNRVIGAVVGKGGTSDEAKEALQEAFMAFERRIIRPDFELQHRLSTYFVTCVFRHWAKKKKKGKMELVEIDINTHIEDFAKSIEMEIAQNDLARILDKTLALIGDRCRDILRLFMNGISMKEIAEKMNFAGGEQVARNEKRKCQERYESYLREHPDILQHIQNLRNG